jgi:hypothetical protein
MIPHLTGSSLHRCLQCHGISRLPEVTGDKNLKRKFKTYPISNFHIVIAEVQTAGTKHLEQAGIKPSVEQDGLAGDETGVLAAQERACRTQLFGSA